MPEQEVVYVGFWKRLYASLIDTILITIVTFPVLFKLYGMRDLDPAQFKFARGPADVFFSYILPALLVLGFWHFKLATPGKMAVSSVIVDADTLEKPSTFQLVIRYAGYFLSTIFFCIGFLWIGIDKRKQGWHDKIANTVVIRTRDDTKSPR